MPLLRSLCAGCLEEDLPAATSGLTHPAPHVRAAALAALPSVPLLGEGALPASDASTTALLWLARNDTGSEDNCGAAAALWELCGAVLEREALFRLVPRECFCVCLEGRYWVLGVRMLALCVCVWCRLHTRGGSVFYVSVCA